MSLSRSLKSIILRLNANSPGNMHMLEGVKKVRAVLEIAYIKLRWTEVLAQVEPEITQLAGHRQWVEAGFHWLSHQPGAGVHQYHAPGHFFGGE